MLEYVAGMAAGYSSGLKWNEEDKLKADMVNRPERWVPITVEQVRARCRELGDAPERCRHRHRIPAAPEGWTALQRAQHLP